MEYLFCLISSELWEDCITNLYSIAITFFFLVGVCAEFEEFSVTTLPDEFIVTYETRASTDVRWPQLTAVLNSLHRNYAIQSRGPFGETQRTFSDFDVIRMYNLTAEDLARFPSILQRQPGIRSVTPQKRIQRKLLTQRCDFDTYCDGTFGRSPKLFGKLRTPTAAGTVPLDPTKQPWRLLKAEELWSRGLCGAGVRIGIFDTGLVRTDAHPHFQRARIRERTDWTRNDGTGSFDEASLRKSNHRPASVEALDGHGHGTFVAGVIAATGSSHAQDRAACPPRGLAPQADLYIFRVFTDSQVSYTSWFLDAFNHAIERKLHVINLSVGGPDFLDQPFVNKVWDLSSSGILLVSAIGNDGPLFGTLNNPADQMDVLGVGGVDATGRVARFSSRGMAAWSLPFGYGQVKPDIVTYSTGVISSALDGKCRTLSGTSVASPVVAGMVVLLINAALERNARVTANQSQFTSTPTTLVPINPASIKQVLAASAAPLDRVHVFGTDPIRWPESTDTSSIFEQGAGLVDLVSSYQIMQRFQPQVTLTPSILDFTQCPYMWPYCSQPCYESMMPVVVNLTILNSIAVTSRLPHAPIYHPYVDRNGHRLRVGFTYSERIWPWSGWLGVHLDVINPDSEEAIPSSRFSGIAEGFITVIVESIGTPNVYSNLTLPVRIQIIPTPNRSRRILYDQFHSIRYPSGYIPRDDLTRSNESLDWLGDHVHTNMRDLYMHLRKGNYFVEVLTAPFTCFNANNYGTLLLVDPEEEYFPAEIDKLLVDVTALGLSVLIFAEWYNTSVMDALRFFDTNTRRPWTPATGGANLPALNNLLRVFGAELGDTVYAGDLHIGHRLVRFTSGTSLRRFPNHNMSAIAGRGVVLQSTLVDLGDQFIRQYSKPDDTIANLLPGTRMSVSEHGNRLNRWRLVPTNTDPTAPVLGLWTPVKSTGTYGRLAIFGDSDCLSSTHLNAECFWLVDALLQFATSPYGKIPRPLAELMLPATETVMDTRANTPRRPKDLLLHGISNVLLNHRQYEGFSNDSLPSEAYRSLPQCPTFVRGSVIPVATFSMHESSFQHQPRLLLYPPVEGDIPRVESDTCHSGLPIQYAPTVQPNAPGLYDLLMVYAFIAFALALISRCFIPRVTCPLTRVTCSLFPCMCRVCKRLWRLPFVTRHRGLHRVWIRTDARI